MEVAGHDGGVDRSRDEDDGKTETKGNLGDEGASREKGRRLDILPDKGVDQSAGKGVDTNLNKTKRPDGLDEILGGVHLIHKGKLADGKTVGKDDVGDCNEGLGKGQTLLGPGRPVNRRKTTRLIAGLDTSRNDGDPDSEGNGDEVDVSQDGDLGKRGRDSDDEEDNGRDDTKDERTGAIVREVKEGNGSCQAMRADQEGELQRKHDTDEFIAKLAHHQLTSIGIVRNLREGQLDLADDVTGINGNETDPDTQDDTRNHTQRRKRRGQTEAAEGNSLDDEDDGETLPAQAVEVVLALCRLALLEVRQLRRLADAEHVVAGVSLDDGSLCLLFHVGGGLDLLGGVRFVRLVDVVIVVIVVHYGSKDVVKYGVVVLQRYGWIKCKKP